VSGQVVQLHLDGPHPLVFQQNLHLSQTCWAAEWSGWECDLSLSIPRKRLKHLHWCSSWKINRVDGNNFLIELCLYFNAKNAGLTSEGA